VLWQAQTLVGMSKSVRVTGPVDILGLVPELVGFMPSDSVVLLVFAGNAICGTYRIDLPAPSDDRVYRRLATTIVGMLCKVRGGDGVLPIVYTTDSFADHGGIPREHFTTRLIERARSAGFRVFDALCVAADGWGSYLASDRDEPHELAEVRAAELLRSAEPGAGDVASDAEELAALPEVDQARRQRVGRAWRRLERTPDAELPAERLDPVAVAEACVGQGFDGVPADEIAVVLWLASRAVLRDAMLYTWAWGTDIGEAAFALNLALSAGAELGPEGERLAGALGGFSEMPRPDRARVTRAIDALRTVTALAPAKARAPLFTMLGWLHWALGRSSVAGRFVDRARRLDPEYGLAELLDAMLQAGHVPEWAFNDPECDGAVGRPITLGSNAPSRLGDD